MSSEHSLFAFFIWVFGYLVDLVEDEQFLVLWFFWSSTKWFFPALGLILHVMVVGFHRDWLMHILFCMFLKEEDRQQCWGREAKRMLPAREAKVSPFSESLLCSSALAGSFNRIVIRRGAPLLPLNGRAPMAHRSAGTVSEWDLVLLIPSTARASLVGKASHFLRTGRESTSLLPWATTLLNLRSCQWKETVKGLMFFRGPGLAPLIVCSSLFPSPA